jgi:hypothetical protein
LDTAGPLRAVFGDKWKPAKRKAPVGTLRAIRGPFTGKIKTRKDAEIVMEGATVGWFKMLQQSYK